MLTLLTVVTAIAGASGFLIKVPTVPTQPRVAPSPVGWVHLQKLILPLFENVCEDSINPIIVRLAQEFTLESSGVYLKPEAIVNLKDLKIGKGLLTKGEIFSEYNEDHINELRIIYEVLYYAKDFDTFYKAAAWARQNVNCGLFVDAIYLAIMKRRDTERLTVPGLYELLPNYFIRKDAIIKASALLSGEEFTPSDTVRVEGNSYIIDANYTANFYDNDDESKLAYFHEDIGLNCYYFLQKLKMAPWFNTPPDTSIGYGEYLYHMMKQLVTRYSLERYSNGLPEVETINWDSFTVSPYDPFLIYSDGNEFCPRPSLHLAGNADIELLKNMQDNIATVVTHMRGSGYNRTQILNHLMEILVTGEKSYETIARRLVGIDPLSNSHHSVMAHYLTSLRDPVFWKLAKNIVDMVDDALKQLNGYTKNELVFPGIEVQNVEVKKMMTAFDYFQFDVTDSLKSTNSDTIFQVKIGQLRLNHKPFAVKLNITSLVTQKGLVNLYLGPKVAPGLHASKKNQFLKLDSFEYNFKIGVNVISRSSSEINNIAEDFTFLRTIRKKVEDAEFGLNDMPLKPVETVSGFPSRLILPKGTPEGLPLQIFVFVAPFVKSSLSGVYAMPSMEFNTAILSPGYPLDLDIEDSQLFNLPNALIKDIIVTHKGDSKVFNYGGAGETKKWSGSTTYDPSSRPDYSAKRQEPILDDPSSRSDYTDKKLGTTSYDPSSRPDYSAKRKQPFDYSSKRGQYGKKNDYPIRGGTDYAAKRGEFIKGKEVIDQTESILGYPDIVDDNLSDKEQISNDFDQNNVVDDSVVESEYNDRTSEKNYTPLKYSPPLRLTSKRNPSIYDFLFPKYTYDDDYTEDRVYE